MNLSLKYLYQLYQHWGSNSSKTKGYKMTNTVLQWSNVGVKWPCLGLLWI